MPIRQVVGSSIVTKYDEQDGKPVLMREPKVFLIDDKDGKAIGINLFMGKRPYAAYGNSGGDREIWNGPARVTVRASRCWCCTTTPSGSMLTARRTASRFPQELLDEAKERGWIVISMKNDWKTAFTKP